LDWGDDGQMLEKTILKAEKWTDDVVLARLRGFPTRSPELDHSVKVWLDWDFIWTQGYAQAWNAIIPHTKYDWVYVLGKGKEIIEIDFESWEQSCRVNEYVIGCSTPDKKHIWHKCGQKELTHWVGKVHEELEPVRTNIDVAKNWNPIFIWDRFDLTDKQDTTFEGYCGSVYRDMTRLKWLLAIQEQGEHRYGTTEGWWKKKKHRLTDVDFIKFDNQSEAMESLDFFVKKCEKWYNKKSYKFTQTW